MSALETPSETETTTPARGSGPLINRNFGLLWAGQSISYIGDAMLDFTFALWIAFDLGRGQSWAPLAVSGVLAASSVGTLVIGPISGVFVDRWDKRRTMMAVILAQAVLTAALLRSEEHTSELQSHVNLVCRLLLEKKKYIYSVLRI